MYVTVTLLNSIGNHNILPYYLFSNIILLHNAFCINYCSSNFCERDFPNFVSYILYKSITECEMEPSKTGQLFFSENFNFFGKRRNAKFKSRNLKRYCDEKIKA